MIDELDQHHERLRARVAAMRDLCRASVPDLVALSHARHQLMTASLDRSRFLKRAAYPALLDLSVPGMSDAIEALDRDLSLHRADVSVHVSSWPPDRIAADWTAYCAASGRLMRKVEDRMCRERAVLGPTLAAFHLQIDA